MSTVSIQQVNAQENRCWFQWGPVPLLAQSWKSSQWSWTQVTPRSFRHGQTKIVREKRAPLKKLGGSCHQEEGHWWTGDNPYQRAPPLRYKEQLNGVRVAHDRKITELGKWFWVKSTKMEELMVLCGLQCPAKHGDISSRSFLLPVGCYESGSQWGNKMHWRCQNNYSLW